MRILLLTFLSLSALYCSLVGGELTRFQYSEPHLGTVVNLVFYADDKQKADQLAAQCFQKVRLLDAILSDYKADSELNRLCSKPIGVAYKVSNELFTVLAQAQAISAKSMGAFDVTLGKQTQAWRERELSGAEVEGLVSYRDVLLDHDKQTVLLQKSLKIDLGGIGKGFIGDQLMLVLKNAGVTHAAVVIGGETMLSAAPPGKKGWRIGIEGPEHKVIGVLVLENTALSTSGDSYQFFEADGERQSHLIDPSTKKSKVNRLNVTTIAPSSMEADAWATALRVLPTAEALKRAQKEPKLEALFIPHKQKASSTNNFPKLHTQ